MLSKDTQKNKKKKGDLSELKVYQYNYSFLIHFIFKIKFSNLNRANYNTDTKRYVTNCM